MNVLPVHDVFLQVLLTVFTKLVKRLRLSFAAALTKVFEDEFDKKVVRNLRVFLEIVRACSLLGKVDRVNLGDEGSVDSHSAD